MWVASKYEPPAGWSGEHPPKLPTGRFDMLLADGPAVHEDGGYADQAKFLK